MTNLERDIQKLYYEMGVFEPKEIDMFAIASYLDIWIHYHDDESTMKCENGLYSVILNEDLSPVEEWQDFGHELAHVKKHVGNQHKLQRPFRKLQESQARNYMYHFCVPTFMLLDCDLINYIKIEDGITFVSETFNVTREFAHERLNRFRNQLNQSKSDQEIRLYMDARHPKLNPENYTNETKAILDKLNRQIKVKKEMQGV